MGGLVSKDSTNIHYREEPFLFLLIPSRPDSLILKQLYLFNIRHSLNVFHKYNPNENLMQVFARLTIKKPAFIAGLKHLNY